MKKLKKGIMVLVAAITCLSMAAMTACDSGNTIDNGTDNTNNTENSGNTNGGTQGGTNGGTNSGTNGGTQGSTSNAGQTDYIDSVSNAMQGQSVVGLGGTLSMVVNATYESADEKEYSIVYESGEGDIVVDVSNAALDEFITVTNASKSYTDDEYANKANGLKDVEKDTAYSTCFVRDGVFYTVSSDKKITSYDSSVELYASDLKATGDEQSLNIYGYLLQGLGTANNYVDLGSEMVTASLIAANYNALTIGDGKMTIDFAKLIKGLYDDVMTTLKSISGKTTVLQLLQSSPVKNLLTALTKVVDTDAVYQTLKTSLEAEDEGAALAAALPIPTEGQSLYDYLITIVNDDGIGTAMGVGQTIGSFTLSDIMTMAQAMGVEANIDIDSLATIVSSLFTITEKDGNVVIKINAGSSATQEYTFKKANFTYNVGSDYKVNGVSADVDLTLKVAYTSTSTTYDSDGVVSTDENYVEVVTDVTFKTDLTVYSQDTMPALTDISKCTVKQQITENSSNDVNIEEAEVTTQPTEEVA